MQETRCKLQKMSMFNHIIVDKSSQEHSGILIALSNWLTSFTLFVISNYYLLKE